jgi:5-methyltetrahydropteroyltriglutamate--homocysteine methyltransferase
VDQVLIDLLAQTLDWAAREVPWYAQRLKRGRRLNDLPFHQLDLEFANRNFETVDMLGERPLRKEVGLGVVDVHTHAIESVERVASGIRRALQYLPPDQIYVDPDCGLKTRTREEAIAKLEVIQRARDEVRREMGI